MSTNIGFSKSLASTNLTRIIYYKKHDDSVIFSFAIRLDRKFKMK